MLNWLKANVQVARESLATEMTKFKNAEFMEACVAGCALVSAADGEISSAEKMKMTGFIQNSNELKVFDIRKVIEIFNSYCDKFAFDEQIGRAEALKAIAKVRSKPEMARMLVRVCIAIDSSEGNFDDSERIICRIICNELGLNTNDFGL